MVTEEVRRNPAKDKRTGIRLEVVDNASENWPQVAQWIQRGGHAARLLDEDGWLSARQIVVAAFVGQKVVGHLGYRITPVRAGAKITLEARIESMRAETPAIEQLLFDRAQAHARLLGCRTLRREY
jgi:hypothetical protein